MRDQKTIRKTFRSLGEARAWRQESQVALRRGTLRAPSPVTLGEAAEEWLAAAQAGFVRTRSGDAYKPSALRAYRQVLNRRVLPLLGAKRYPVGARGSRTGRVLLRGGPLQEAAGRRVDIVPRRHPLPVKA